MFSIAWKDIQFESSSCEDLVQPTDFYRGRTDQKLVTYTPKNHVVELTKFAPLLLAELNGKWSLLRGGTQLRMFNFKASNWTLSLNISKMFRDQQ